MQRRRHWNWRLIRHRTKGHGLRLTRQEVCFEANGESVGCHADDYTVHYYEGPQDMQGLTQLIVAAATLVATETEQPFCVEPKVRAFPQRYRAVPPERTTDRRVVEGYTIEYGVWLGSQELILCELAWLRSGPLGWVEPCAQRAVGIVAIAAGSGEARLLEAVATPGASQRRQAFLGTPFACRS